MGRDPHRAPGRLAPQRPEYERGAPAQPSPPDRQPARLPPRPDHPLPTHPPLSPEETFSFEERPAIAAPVPNNGDRYEEEPAWTVDDTQPKRPVSLPSPVQTVEDTGRLSIQERHELLIHTIRLYDEEWKLARIYANPKNDRLQAFLLPRDKQIDLKDAISKNQALIIMIDPRGNTEIKEPKKRGLLKKIFGWLFGGE